MHFDGQTFSVILEQLSFTKRFWENNAKMDFYKKKMVCVFFMKLKIRWLQIGLHDLKNTKQLKFCLGYIFFTNF